MTPAMTRPVPTGASPSRAARCHFLSRWELVAFRRVAEQGRRKVERQRRNDGAGPAGDLPSDQRAEHRARAGGGAGDREEIDELAAVDPAADHHRLMLDSSDDCRTAAYRRARAFWRPIELRGIPKNRLS